MLEMDGWQLQHLERIELERGVLREVAPFLREREYRRSILVADENTYKAAGERLARELEGAGLAAKLCLIQPNDMGDVVADEASLVQLLLEVGPEETDALIAVGSGTIHDIVRFAAHKSGKPFVSVPTAPSVD
ncbi:iron-containing alcohol dehydrogenase, partial [Paenibacillus macerans]|nr:iron-containing alcohol dehydrogenase [Paenibacillus macerans]